MKLKARNITIGAVLFVIAALVVSACVREQRIQLASEQHAAQITSRISLGMTAAEVTAALSEVLDHEPKLNEYTSDSWYMTIGLGTPSSSLDSWAYATDGLVPAPSRKHWVVIVFDADKRVIEID